MARVRYIILVLASEAYLYLLDSNYFSHFIMRYPVISTTYQSGNNPARQGQVYLNAHYDGSGTSSSTNITSSNTSRSSNGPVVLRRNKKKQHQNLGTLFCYTNVCSQTNDSVNGVLEFV